MVAPDGTASASAAADASPPITLTALAASSRLDDALAADLWGHLDLDPELDAEEAANIPADFLKSTLAEFVESRGLSAGAAGRITTIFAKLERHRARLDDPAPQAAAETPPTAPVVAAVPGGKISAVLDQMDDRPYEALDMVTRAELRANHKEAVGGPPPVGKEPSSDQLAAMMSRLKKEEPPYADFAIFQPHGQRLAKYHKFDAQIFVGGTLTSQALKGPTNFTSWRDCWALFRATMISLSEVSPATLDDYERGLEQLVALHPTQWGIIYCADELMRSEQWKKLQEGLQDSGSWPTFRPWDHVIRLSTYGGPDSPYAMQHWWSLHVIFPCQQGMRSPMAFLRGVEGTDMLPMPGGMTVTSAASSSGAAPQQDRSQNTRNQQRKKQKKGAHGGAPWSDPYPTHQNQKGNHGGKGKGKDKGKGGGKGKHGGKTTK
jgi:hypothetical protein